MIQFLQIGDGEKSEILTLDMFEEIWNALPDESMRNRIVLSVETHKKLKRARRRWLAEARLRRTVLSSLTNKQFTRSVIPA